jgi:hypothetical protein
MAGLNTRPDILKSIQFLSQFLQNPSSKHINAAKQIIQYADHWRNHKITYYPKDKINEPRLYAATDASYADTPGRRSSQAHAIFLNGGPVSWAAQRQTTVATSTTEAELTGLSAGVTDDSPPTTPDPTQFPPKREIHNPLRQPPNRTHRKQRGLVPTNETTSY